MPSAKSQGDPDYITPYNQMFRKICLIVVLQFICIVFNFRNEISFFFLLGFSFGPILPETFESDIKLFSEVLEEYKKEAGA